MANYAVLFAEDTPGPYNPEAKVEDPNAHNMIVATARWRIPVFWMFCFEADEDFVEVEVQGGKFDALVAPLAAVRRRLEERDELVRQWFPAHVEIWKLWRQTIEAVERRFLKLDPYEIWLFHEDDNTLGGIMCDAMDWFDGQNDFELEALLALAGIESYDAERRTFTFDETESNAEMYLIGWYEKQV